ncbi:MAG: ATP-binding cassette domain-containing protein, partial [Candidatus Omnitrophota bacterium]
VEKSVIERTIQPVMKELGIWEFRGRDISLLSEGEKKRVAIARAMVLDTKVILLDEITANIDRTHADIIETAVLRLASGAGKTVIMTTHDLNMAYRLTEDVIFLVKGSITDSPLWNVYKADLTGIDSVKKAVLAGGAEIYAATDKTGAVSINIDPRNIIISRHAVDSSALNNLKGKIVSITERNGIIDLVADVKPVRDMKNVKLHIFITCKSFKDMRLGLGEDIFAVFKATAVEVM